MKPKIVKKSAIKLAGFVSKTNDLSEANLNKYTVKDLTTKLWEDCIKDGSLEKLKNESFIKNRNQYGICVPGNLTTHEFEYFIGIEIKKGKEIPKEYHICIIPEALYAVFRTPPAESTKFSTVIDNTYLEIHLNWLPKSGYVYLEDKADFCYYDVRYSNGKTNVCDIYIPIAKIKQKKSINNKNSDTKKCLGCSRIIAVHYFRCPHCRMEKFEYDE